MSKNEMAKGGQAPSYNETNYGIKWSKKLDKEETAKPVGYRFTDKLAKRLGKKVTTKPTQEQIEKYSGKGVYWENRKDKSDLNPKAKLEEGGEMARGGVTQHGLKKGDEIILEGVYLMIVKNNGKYYRINISMGTREEIDVYKDYMAKGGQAPSYNETNYGIKWSKALDKEQTAKPVGYRFTDKLANRLGKKVTTKPTQEQIEKYSGKGVYWENRKDKSDMNPKAKLEDGGENEYAKGGQAPSYKETYYGTKWSKSLDKEERAKPVGYRFRNSLAKRLGVNPFAKPTAEQVRKYLGKGVYFENRKDKSDINPKAKLKDGGDTNLYYVELDAYEFEDRSFQNFLKKNDIKAKNIQGDDIQPTYKFIGKKSSLEKLINEEYFPGEDYDQEERVEFLKGIKKYRGKFEDGGIMAKGGQAPSYNETNYGIKWSKALDKEQTAKPVGYRFTDKLANRLGKKVTTKPTYEQIEKYKGKGVYWENRKDKSDLNPKAKLNYGGPTDEPNSIELLARGGGVPRTSNTDSKAFTENHLPFIANNLEGKTLENGDYVVLSYGYYPIWFWHKRTNKWFGNKDKFSVTTAKQISQSRPTYEATMVSRSEMDDLMAKSVEGKDFKAMGGTI
jgi:hypothetical protein